MFHVSCSMTKLSAKPAQLLVDIREIRDGILILKNGSLRVVLMASSINFALKSQDEQDAIVFQYQTFLNSLDFSAQFFIQSRKLNIEPYLDTLRERLKREYNELLKIQISEYVEFVKSFVDSANIVSKSFYVVVPYTPVVIYDEGGIGKTLGSLISSADKKQGLNEEKFEEYKTQLYQRVEVIRQGLVRTGVRAVPLNTEETLELFYGLYNPGEAEKGKMPAITT